MAASKNVPTSVGDNKNLHHFETITNDLLIKGFSINPNALPYKLAKDLVLQMQSLPKNHFSQAGIGRNQGHTINTLVRSDKIYWITDEAEAGRNWLQWVSALQMYLNKHLFLGLFSFESHFAHYRPGDFYKRHLDAFNDSSSRILSLLVYLNPEWTAEDEGELVIYHSELDQTGIKVPPCFATVVVFLSEEFPHEVLPSKRDRYSIAGWFRKNTSSTARVDPPL